MRNLFRRLIVAIVRKGLKDESGMALVLAMLILTVLALLGASSVFLAQTDMEIASNEKVGLQALYAAEAGLSKAVAMLNISSTAGKIDPPSISWGQSATSSPGTWSQSFSLDLTGEDNVSTFFNVSVTVEFLKTAAGCAGNVAFYNQTCGFTSSQNSSGGQPVYVVSSWAYDGDFRKEVRLELTRQELSYMIKGGFTANGPVKLQGNPVIDGNSYDSDGNPGGTCTMDNLSGVKPSVYANGTTIENGSPSLPTGKGNGVDVPSTPWDALGLPNETAFIDMFGAGPPTSLTTAQQTSLSEYTWVDGSIGSGLGGGPTVNGTGILVVHNDEFDSANWALYTDPAVGGDDHGGADCSLLTPPNPGWCLTYNSEMGGANPKKYAPASFGPINGGTFKGIVIADEINIQGNVTIIGAIISLTTTQITATAAGNPTILFSCEAIEDFAGGKTNYKLNWQRMYD